VSQLTFVRPADKFVYFVRGFLVDGEPVEQYEIGIVQERQDDLYVVLVVSLDVCVSIPRSEFEFFDPEQVGDAFPKKVCNVCQRYLDTTLFEFNQNGRDNRRVRRPSCRDCRRKIDGHKIPPSDGRIWLARNPKPYLVPFRCPICDKITIPGLTSKVVLDHDHRTGRPRAWICDSCNTGIGRFKDDIELLYKAIKYLED
jgi:hypothetical protein